MHEGKKEKFLKTLDKWTPTRQSLERLRLKSSEKSNYSMIYKFHEAEHLVELHEP